jgi:hypothetical protein
MFFFDVSAFMAKVKVLGVLLTLTYMSSWNHAKSNFINIQLISVDMLQQVHSSSVTYCVFVFDQEAGGKSAVKGTCHSWRGWKKKKKKMTIMMMIMMLMTTEMAV